MTAPTTGLRARAKQERLARIRAAAARLFSEQGYEATTTKEIAEVAEVGEATLFRYVEGKHELLLLVLGEQMDQVIRTIQEQDRDRAGRATTAQDHLERIYALYRSRADFYATDPEGVLNYMQYGFTAGSRLGAEGVRQGDEVIALTASILDQARDQQLLRSDTDSQAVAQNCNAIYIHEVLRSPVRQVVPGEMASRLHRRLAAQLEPLLPH